MSKCKDCGMEIIIYNSLNRRCRDCTIKKYKPITKIGKKAKEWIKQRSVWLEEDKIDSGWICDECKILIRDSSDVQYHHIEHRSTAPEKRLEKSNCLKLCQKCHNKFHDLGEE